MTHRSLRNEETDRLNKLLLKEENSLIMPLKTVSNKGPTYHLPSDLIFLTFQPEHLNVTVTPLHSLF